MSINGFIELHDCYTHAAFIVNVNAIESVGDKFIIYAQGGHDVDERYDEILKLIEAAPAADVADVVRCGECEHRIFVEVGDVGQIGVCEIFGCAMQISSFCSYGKRKENT